MSREFFTVQQEKQWYAYLVIFYYVTMDPLQPLPSLPLCSYLLVGKQGCFWQHKMMVSVLNNLLWAILQSSVNHFAVMLRDRSLSNTFLLLTVCGSILHHWPQLLCTVHLSLPTKLAAQRGGSQWLIWVYMVCTLYLLCVLLWLQSAGTGQGSNGGVSRPGVSQRAPLQKHHFSVTVAVAEISSAWRS